MIMIHEYVPHSINDHENVTKQMIRNSMQNESVGPGYVTVSDQIRSDYLSSCSQFTKEQLLQFLAQRPFSVTD